MHSIHARMVVQWVKAPFNLYCDLFIDEKLKDPMNDYQQLLFNFGREHEKHVVAKLYSDAKEVPVVNREEGFKVLIELMKQGVHRLHNFPVFFEDLTGNVDILERVEGVSSLGRYYYVVKEIKSAKNMKEHHKMQAFFYNYIIGKIQGFTPKEVCLVNREFEEQWFPYDEAALLKAIDGVRELLRGKKVSPTYGAAEWPWESYTKEQAIIEQDISILSGVGLSTKQKLNAVGIFKVKDVVGAQEEAIVEIDGFGEASVNALKRNAQAIVNKEAIKIGAVKLPKKKTEIYLDLEGTGEPMNGEFEEVTYLIGVLMSKSSKDEYRSFVADTLAQEKAMLTQFFSWLEQQEDVVIYHWHHYERTHLKKLCAKYHIPVKQQNSLFKNMIDLYVVATRAFAFPTYGTSIKAIAPWMGFHWRQKEVNAMQSIALYLNYAKDPVKNKNELQKVIDYNEDDVRATKVVKDWLVKHA